MIKRMVLWVAALLVLVAGGVRLPPAADAGDAVAQYHADGARSGRYIVSGLTAAKVSVMRPAPVFRTHVYGPAYAAPLYFKFEIGRAMLLVATEQNAVEALDPASGNLIWRTVLGPPVPRSALPCGDIEPMGITGTPVIDRGVVYVAAMVLRHDGVPQQMIFALGLSDGRIRPDWPLSVGLALEAQKKFFVAANQGQRSALSVGRGRVFVAYAGHFGDCRYYHGWVVGVDETHPDHVTSFATEAPGGGIWAPGGMVSDGQSFFVATGNTFGARRWAGGEAVIRLGLDSGFSSRPQDYFAPSDWHQLDERDLDLGATNPMLIRNQFVLALGKDGDAYLLDRTNLGGIGGQVAERHVSRVPIRTAPAGFAVGADEIVVFQGEGAGCPTGEAGDLVALKIGPGPKISVAWCAQEHGLGAPIVTTAENGADPVVWAVGAEGDERLRAFRGSDGKLLFTSQPMGLVRRFQTPVVGGGQIYVAADSAVYGFRF